MIQKISDQFAKDKTRIDSDLKEIKEQQDVVKVSYTVNEKLLLEKIKAMINSEMRIACKDMEKELLMNMWISELKEIIKNFEKLKKMQPKEFVLQIDEIVNTVKAFKQKLSE